MRNRLFLFISITTLALIGCSNRSVELKVADATPIMPIHLLSDTTCIYLTDYVPQWETDSVITLANSDTLSVLHLNKGDDTISIPVLPKLPVQQALVTVSATDAEVTIATIDGSRLEQVLVFIQNRLLSSEALFTQEDGSIKISLPTCPIGRSYLRVYARGEKRLYNDILVPLQDGHPVLCTEELNRHDDQGQVLYSILIDRFQDGDSTNNRKLNSPEVLDIVDYQGGDFRGITNKINEGFFDTLGITTLWISPITQNPWSAWGCYPFPNGNKYNSSMPYTKFSGYHGYWPIYTTVIDKRLGTNDDLKTLLATAHNHGINVVLDYVANHLHKDAPVYIEHPDWHTDSILPDGTRNFELWDEQRLTTWFDTHLPTLDLERQEVYEAMTDSALFWLENFDLDGFRHDACKHIPECYWRTLTHKAVTRFPGRHIWMIGETYGSPELINTYVKSGMLNAQFDFNIYFTAIHALMGDDSMASINETILTSLATYGAHHTMGNISGNHDQARFASVAGGALNFNEDAKEAGWTREVGIGNAPKAYHTALLLEMLNLTIPGVPCIYQGDEYAEVGANDPDNRKMVRFDNLNDNELAFRTKVQELIRLRRSNMALLYGEYIPVYSDATTLEFERIYMGDRIRVRISTSDISTITRNNEILFQL